MSNLPDLPALVAKWRAASTRATDSANASRVPHVASVLDGAADTLRVCANELEAALSALNQAPGERLTECELHAVRAAMANADHDAGDYDDEDEDAQHARHLHDGLRKLLAASPTVEPAESAGGEVAPHSAQGVLIEGVELVGMQGEPAGEMRVSVRINGRDVEVIRTQANVISHSVSAIGITAALGRGSGGGSDG